MKGSNGAELSLVFYGGNTTTSLLATIKADVRITGLLRVVFLHFLKQRNMMKANPTEQHVSVS